jgi:FkbM family methyltransferase
MTSSITLTLNDQAQIVVPDSLNLITPYVLIEQQDWFEDEIKFLRCLLKPGQKIIDIGANYGVYTLSMAHTVGATGKIWAFEPASSTASFLAQGIAANKFTQVVLEQSALSNVCGVAELSLNQNSELNSIVHGETVDETTETVPLVTLDECLDRYGWENIDFIKIDAEGEESNILTGGDRFFAELSPLVQYEIKAGDELHLGLVKTFTDLGYASYRLVPGLNLLVPFDLNAIPDGYLLNLFCCKPDRANQLANEGFLLNTDSLDAEILAKLSKRIKLRDRYGWRHTLAKLPYGDQLSDLWETTMAAGNSTEVNEAISFYNLSHDPQLTTNERFTALQASFNILSALCEGEPASLRLASLARVAIDLGERLVAVQALMQISNHIARSQQIDVSEPFLSPSKRCDSLSPGAAINNWCFTAILEELERIGAFSSFYTGLATQQRLELIVKLGFGGEEMSRRLSLLRSRFDLN